LKNILYIGDLNIDSTSGQRKRSLERIGYSVFGFDPKVILPLGFFISRFHYRTGFKFLQNKLINCLSKLIKELKEIDLIWIDSGEYIGLENLLFLKKIGCPIVLYNVDDPTGKRDGRRFKSLIGAIHLYDLVVVVRPETAKECYSFGAKKVLHVLRSYDEIAHKRSVSLEEKSVKFRFEVTFIGTWMPGEKRDEFMLTLISKGVPLSIWGNGWHKSKYYVSLKPFIMGNAIYGDDYVSVIQTSKICLGLLSKGNRDQHTTRSLEIPFIGSLFCAERTNEHMSMFKDGEEAVLWRNADECANLCLDLLKNDKRRKEISIAGHKRVKMLGVGNEEICKKILGTFEI
jgi:spore maturation protein CgeB